MRFLLHKEALNEAFNGVITQRARVKVEPCQSIVLNKHSMQEILIDIRHIVKRDVDLKQPLILLN